MLLAALLVLSPCLDNKPSSGGREAGSDTKCPLEDSFQYVKQLK